MSDSDDSSDDSDGEDDDRRCGRTSVEPDADNWFPAKLGIGGASQKCPPLQCGSCGFEVHRFSGHRWHRQIDYMHFRHFEGHSYDLAKLRAKLAPDAAFAAPRHQGLKALRGRQTARRARRVAKARLRLVRFLLRANFTGQQNILAVEKY